MPRFESRTWRALRGEAGTAVDGERDGERLKEGVWLDVARDGTGVDGGEGLFDGRVLRGVDDALAEGTARAVLSRFN